MTVRRYYQDAKTTRFSAQIIDRFTYEGRPAIMLDETYFYPNSGGQPHDTGWVSDGNSAAAVIDVVADSPDAPVTHILDRQWMGNDGVTGEIDWPRRFDHMQQHSGQHILSQAFIRVAEAETVGFHLSDQTVTIDLDRAEVSDEELRRAEQLANEVVWTDMQVTTSFVELAEAQQLALRKIPPKNSGQIRLINIGDFDLTACGGTHVPATGQIGLIKLVKAERRGNVTRVEFRCGERALDDYRRKHEVTTALASNLTTGYDDLVDAVERLREETRHWRSAAHGLQKELAAYEAAALVKQAALVNGQRIVAAVFEGREPDSLRQLANRLNEHKLTVALLVSTGERTHLVFGRSPDAPGNMGELLRTTLAQLDGGKGGGSPTLAQGSGPPIDRPSLATLLENARQLQQTAKPVE